ncbi:MAG: hypothetical protein ACNS62_07095 [Candidatus Cyclobacteriaceae bacterium M3_2C_046]
MIEEKIRFLLVFVFQQQEINPLVSVFGPRLDGDAIVWLAYPKKLSRKYSSDINRDSGWDIMVTYDLEPVRQVAIDEDWSALRFRKVAFIKKMTRKFAKTTDGKRKSGKN